MSCVGLTAPAVNIRGEGSPVAGSNYTLICDVTTPPFDSNIEVTVLWKDPLQASLYMNGTPTDKSNVFNSRLPLNHLTFDKEGTYVCRASYTVNGRESPGKRRNYYLAISELSHSLYTPIILPILSLYRSC